MVPTKFLSLNNPQFWRKEELGLNIRIYVDLMENVHNSQI